MDRCRLHLTWNRRLGNVRYPAALRRHFMVDAESITIAALAQLVAKGALPANVVPDAIEKYDMRSIPATCLDAPTE